jgi:aspartyl/asparaginyl-tRNA synthetase
MAASGLHPEQKERTGLGLERWAAGLVSAANLREVALFPRDLSRLTP